MGQLRKPLQGVGNILRFNWHFYLLAAGTVVLLAFSATVVEPYGPIARLLAVLITGTTAVSLLVSVYVYDFSSLYQLRWLDAAPATTQGRILNVHAGFDETSSLIRDKYPEADLQVFDFYDPSKHTEVSIKRLGQQTSKAPFPISSE